MRAKGDVHFSLALDANGPRARSSAQALPLASAIPLYQLGRQVVGPDQLGSIIANRKKAPLNLLATEIPRVRRSDGNMLISAGGDPAPSSTMFLLAYIFPCAQVPASFLSECLFLVNPPSQPWWSDTTEENFPVPFFC